MILTCEQCGKEYTPRNPRKKDQRFCSREGVYAEQIPNWEFKEAV